MHVKLQSVLGFFLNICLHLLSSLSSAHASVGVPPDRRRFPQRSELWLWSGEEETFHRLSRGKREHGEERHAGLQRLIHIFLLFFFLLVVSQAALPWIRLRRGPVHQSADSGPLRPASHRRERRRWERRLAGQPPLGLRLRLLALPAGRQRLLPLLPAGRAPAVRRPQDPGVHHG